MTTETAKIPIPIGRGADTADDIIGILMEHSFKTYGKQTGEIGRTK